MLHTYWFPWTRRELATWYDNMTGEEPVVAKLWSALDKVAAENPACGVLVDGEQDPYLVDFNVTSTGQIGDM